DSRFAIEEDLVQQADSVIAECPQDFEDLVTLYNADPARLYMAPCGIDVEQFHPESKALARLRTGIRQDAKVILQLGRLVPRKGVDDVIRALGELNRR